MQTKEHPRSNGGATDGQRPYKRYREYTTVSLSGEETERPTILARCRVDAIEAERRLLGTILYAGHLEKVRKLISVDRFRDPRHELVYNVMLSLADHGKPVDFATLVNRMNADERLQQAGGIGYVAKLTHDPLPGWEISLARDMVDQWRRHDAVREAHEAMMLAYEGAAL